jgi:hypothetical protein
MKERMVKLPSNANKVIFRVILACPPSDDIVKKG